MADSMERSIRNHLREKVDEEFHLRMKRARITIAEDIVKLGTVSLSLTRLKLGMSQLQVAERLGISKDQMFDIENGKAPVPTHLIDAYADTLGVSPEHIIQFSKEHQ